MQIAKRQAVVNPENTFFSVKRFIGRKMNEVKDESKQVGDRLFVPTCSWLWERLAVAGRCSLHRLYIIVSRIGRTDCVV